MAVGGNGGRQHAGDRGDRPIQRQFAQHEVGGEHVAGNGPDRRHDAERDRQVVVAAFLWQVGRRQVDRDALGRHGEAGGEQGGADAFARLADRLVPKADDGEDDVAARDLHLHIDGSRLDPLERDRRHPHNHGAPAG